MPSAEEWQDQGLDKCPAALASPDNFTCFARHLLTPLSAVQLGEFHHEDMNVRQGGSSVKV
eukprot:834154-Amphidinium_carterae.2